MMRGRDMRPRLTWPKNRRLVGPVGRALVRVLKNCEENPAFVITSANF